MTAARSPGWLSTPKKHAPLSVGVFKKDAGRSGVAEAGYFGTEPAYFFAFCKYVKAE